jgi:hypothetical protein
MKILREGQGFSPWFFDPGADVSLNLSRSAKMSFRGIKDFAGPDK